MTKHTDNEEDKREDKRKPYEPPTVVSDEVFETLALSCNNVGPPCFPVSS